MDIFLRKKFSIKKTTYNIFVGCIVILLGILLITIGIPKYVELGYGSKNTLSPRSFPTLIASVLLILGVIQTVQAVLYKKYNRESEEEYIHFYAISFVIIGLCLIFLLGLKQIGYPIMNVMVMMVAYYLCGGKNLVRAVVISVLFTVVSMLFFYVYLKLPIPMGLLDLLRL